MKKFAFIFLAISLALITGCAGITRNNFAGNQKYQDIKSAKQNVEPIGKVEYGDFKNIKISSDSPSIESDSVKGRFEIATVRGEKGQLFSITVAAICDCLVTNEFSFNRFCEDFNV